MAYDEVLATRIRALLDDVPDLTEQKMFGGLAFLIGGNMAIAASSHGGLMVRVNPTEWNALLSNSAVRPVEMRGRVMSGWLLVDRENVQSDDTLARWVTVGTSYARSLPSKL